MKKLLDKIKSNNYDKNDLIQALSLKEDEASLLFECSNKIREEYCGNAVQIRGLLEISNICSRNCNYCGVRANNIKIKRYKIPTEEIYSLAIDMDKKGIKTLVMQGGESATYPPNELADLIKEIKSNTDMAVTLSLGEHSYETYKLWKEAGADRYLLRHETANSEHYRFLHPDGILETRMECLKKLKTIGYQTGVGCMVGSPGQKLEYLAEDLEFIKSFKPEMVGIGPYIMHEDTPFKGELNGDVFLTLKMLALVRIITKKALMPATTALATIGNEGYKKGLSVGCDVIMINFTPQKYKELYKIYPGKKCISENYDTILAETKNLIISCNRTVSTDKGHAR